MPFITHFLSLTFILKTRGVITQVVELMLEYVSITVERKNKAISVQTAACSDEFVPAYVVTLQLSM